MVRGNCQLLNTLQMRDYLNNLKQTALQDLFWYPEAAEDVHFGLSNSFCVNVLKRHSFWVEGGKVNKSEDVSVSMLTRVSYLTHKINGHFFK